MMPWQGTAICALANKTVRGLPADRRGRGANPGRIALEAGILRRWP